MNCLRRVRWIAFIVFFLVAAAMAQNDPIADARAVVVAGQARFTILTPEMIRMEWSADKKFEDHASLVFINRKMPVPAFQTKKDRGWLVLRTEKLELRYREKSGKFGEKNLSVAFDLDGKRVSWHPGMEDAGNLKGTTRTLDGVRGSDTTLEPGLVSRDGWVVIDDSKRLLFDNSDWPWAMERPKDGDEQDWYFFGYGHDYKKTLGDFIRVAGRIPMPPHFAFGTWWSRYWAYTDEELMDLVRGFQSHEIPLDVLVIDMDWHLTFGTRWWENKKDQSGHSLGWTGYTWNNNYFPDPPDFLAWVHKQGLKDTLNMHPASGVQPFEAAYPAMAKAMGIDPATKQYVKFDIANKKFAENYLNILHHPLEKEGVDFFWLDWQQEKETSVEGLNPTWWLNYVHTSDMEREGKRPLIFHRWGGLGNHRYQIGFSGDTIAVWDSLAFQPYFTATAANVGYGYWSHDIGGHMHGTRDPELYTRWIQFGAFSPILRTHTTKDPESERRIWAYPAEYAKAMRDAYVLRYALIPYIYTASRYAYDTGLSICRPLYYEYPEAPEAYEFKNEYFFGNDMIVSPVVAPEDKQSELAKETIWLPEGTWYEWSSGAKLQGPAKLERTFALNELPVYVRAGAIIPMEPKMEHTDQKPLDPLILEIYPGANGKARVYEDGENTLGYKKTEYTFTPVTYTEKGEDVRVRISAVEGSFPGMLTERSYEARFVMSWPPEQVMWNGQPLGKAADENAIGWRYDGDTMTLIVRTPKAKTSEMSNLVVKKAEDVSLLDGMPGKINRARQAMEILEGAWPDSWAPDGLIKFAQVGRRISWHPEDARSEIEKARAEYPAALKEVDDVDVVGFPEKAMAHMGEKATERARKPRGEKR
ncbi:MAG TPA: TIM-barrel domain-containing protein [Terriglobales bacterium]|nr:TIM-barrel domain-containing protein [Terriglobales bacterium]